MSSVERIKSTPKAAAPSSSSSRKRTRSEQGGVNKRDVSRCKAKRLTNNTNHGGVDTSQINPTQSNQNDKNDYGLDPSSNNNLSNYNKTATNNNKNNNVSKSWNVTHIKQNFSGSTSESSSPSRTPLQNTKQVLLPSPIRGRNGNNNSKDIGSSAEGIKSIFSSTSRKKSSRHRRSLVAPQQSKHHTSDSTDNKKFPGQKGNGGSNYVTKLMFANKNVLKIIPTLRQKAKEGYHLCAQAVKQFDKLESRNLEHAIANKLAPEIKKEFRECSLEYTDLLGSIANCGQDLPDDLEKSAIGISLLFGIKSSIDFINPLFPPDKMNPNNCCLKWVGGHMIYSALLQAGTDPSVLTPQMARDFLDQNSTMFDAFGACCTGNDIDPEHPDEEVRKKADPKGNKFETIETQLEKIAGGELCGLTGDDRMKFWEFFALLFMAWRGQYYYVKSGGKQYTLVVMSFTAANFCQDNPNRNVLENKQIQILTLTHSQVQMYMMPNRTTYPPPVVVKLDRHLQILLDKLDGKLLPDGETRVVASGMTTYFQQRAKLLTRDGNEDPTAEAWRVFHEDENKLTPAHLDLLEQDYSYQTAKAWKDAKLHEFDLSKLTVKRRAILDKNICYKTKKGFDDLASNGGVLSKVSKESRAILDKNICYKTKKGFDDLASNGGVLSKVSKESRAILDKNKCYQIKEAFNELDTKGDISKVSEESRAVLDENKGYQIKKAFEELDSNGGVLSKLSIEKQELIKNDHSWKLHDKALTKHPKMIEEMKKDKSNYVLVGKENVFHIPASKKTVYKYVWTLRHLAKDNWKRLKFEQAAGISLFEMEKAYSQLSMKEQCAPKNIDKRLEQEEIIRALAEKNNSAQKTQEEVVDKSVKKCVKCGMEKKRWSYLIEEWDKLEDNERVCQVCTKAEKEGKQIARFDPAVRRELDQAVRRLEEKQAAEKMRLEQEKKAAAEVQSRLSAHKQMEQLERVAISVVRPSKEVELGLGVGKRDDRMTVTSIAPGIFDGSQLERGMIIDSVNGSCPLSFKDAWHTLQNAEGRINIWP